MAERTKEIEARKQKNHQTKLKKNPPNFWDDFTRWKLKKDYRRLPAVKNTPKGKKDSLEEALKGPHISHTYKGSKSGKKTNHRKNSKGKK